MNVGHTVVPASPAIDSSYSRGRSAVAWVRTRGTPVLVLMEERLPMPSATAIVDSALRAPRLGLPGVDSLGAWRIVTKEGGRFDSIEGRPLYGWEVHFEPAQAHDFRLILVAMGSANDRPYRIPIEERLRTARVVGQYRVDLKQGRIERLESAAEAGR